MNTKSILAVGGLALIAATAWASSGDRDSKASWLDARQDVLPMESVLPMVAGQYPGRIVEVELESENGAVIYEIELLTPEGRKRKLLVDARTGQPVRPDLSHESPQRPR